MFAEEHRSSGAGPHGGPETPGRSASAVAAGKRRRRLQAACAAEPAGDGGTARKRPGKRRRAGKRRAAEEEGPRAGPGEPRTEREPRQLPDKDGSAELPGPPARRLYRRQRRKNRCPKTELPEEPEGEQSPGPGAPGLAAAPESRSAALRARMEERLLGARFRYINQQLYTSSSREAARLFQNDPQAFEIYHRGFSRQLQRWPENPVDRIIRYLRRRPASLVVADFGCGDCKIATSVRNKVHSFDLVPLSPLVTVCDMAEVPLAAESVDVAVFCLALMGTNLQEILAEANRVLKLGGTLMVAEVASRFEDVRAFLTAMAQLGFKSVSKDLSSTFFLLLEFAKTGAPRPRPAPGLRLRPCLYKRR